MLNYIWAGLIISAFVFAVGYDVRDLTGDAYRNGEPLPVALAFPSGYDTAARRVPVEIRIDPRRYAEFYRLGRSGRSAASYPGYLLQTLEGVQLRFAADAQLPQPLATIAKVSESRDKELQGRLVGFTPPAPGTAPDSTTGGAPSSPPRAWSSSRCGSSSSTPSPPPRSISPRPPRRSRSAWSACSRCSSGSSRSASRPGLIYGLVKLVRPVLRPLFPEIPPDHPALGLIALNLTANWLRAGQRGDPVRHQGDGGAAEAQPVGGHRQQRDGDAPGDQHRGRAARPAGAAPGAARTPDQPARLPDHRHGR